MIQWLRITIFLHLFVSANTYPVIITTEVTIYYKISETVLTLLCSSDNGTIILASLYPDTRSLASGIEIEKMRVNDNGTIDIETKNTSGNYVIQSNKKIIDTLRGQISSHLASVRMGT